MKAIYARRHRAGSKTIAAHELDRDEGVRPLLFRLSRLTPTVPPGR